MPTKRPYDPDDEEMGSNEQTQEFQTSAQIDELLQKLEVSEQKTSEHWERIVRMEAAAKNAALRSEREVANAHKYAIEKFIGELLPIVDSLELCVNSDVDSNPVAASMVEGVKLTLKMFYTAMEKFGIQQVNPLSEAFDPEFQQAISVEVNPSVKAGTVLSVLQKGYTLNGRLIRPALVVVSKTEN